MFKAMKPYQGFLGNRIIQNIFRGNICSEKGTVFLELRSRKTVSFKEQIMSEDKDPSIFLPLMEAIDLSRIPLQCT